MNPHEILVCRQPEGDYWQLGPLDGSPDGPLLVAWRIHPAALDAGLPEQVARMLALSLVARFRVTCLCSQSAAPPSGSWSFHPGDVAVPVPTGHALQAPMRNKSIPSDSLLVSTVHAETLVKLLEDAEFPWWMQGQLAILSDQTFRRPLQLNYEFLEHIQGPFWWQSVATVDDMQGIMKPGVDGDVAGIYIHDAELRESWLSALESECAAAGMLFKFVEMSNL